MRRYLAVCLATLLIGCSSAETGPISGVAIEGRVLEMKTGLLTGFPGTRFVMDAPGPVMIELESLGELGALDVRVDNGAWERIDLAKGEQTLTLGTNGPHRLEIIRRNEDWQGALRVKAITPAKGRFGPTPDLPDRKILFIGDSITAGAGTDVSYEDAGLGKPLDNARFAFPRVLADRLDAQVHHIAYGGRGIIRDWRGYPTGREGVLNAPAFYALSTPGQNTVWDHASWIPDAIVIGLGTNDFNSGIPDRDYFVDQYVAFIRRLQTDAPGAPILILSSPMTDGEKGEALKSYLDRVAERSGDGVYRLDTDIYHGRPSVVGHPTDTQHVAIADEIAPMLEEMLKD